MPTFSDFVGAIVSIIIFLMVAGRPDLISKAILEVRRIAIEQAHTDWGCPSVANRNACKVYDPNLYR